MMSTVTKIVFSMAQKPLRVTSASCRTFFPAAQHLLQSSSFATKASTYPYWSGTRTMASTAKSAFVWDEKRTLGVTTPEELEKRINRIKKLASEARLCMKDCDEVIDTEYFDEELASARAAVERTGIEFSELLEELALTDEGVQLLNEVRRIHAPEVEALRHELRQIGALKKGVA